MPLPPHPFLQYHEHNRFINPQTEQSSVPLLARNRKSRFIQRISTPPPQRLKSPVSLSFLHPSRKPHTLISALPQAKTTASTPNARSFYLLQQLQSIVDPWGESPPPPPPSRLSGEGGCSFRFVVLPAMSTKLSSMTLSSFTTWQSLSPMRLVIFSMSHPPAPSPASSNHLRPAFDRSIDRMQRLFVVVGVRMHVLECIIAIITLAHSFLASSFRGKHVSQQQQQQETW